MKLERFMQCSDFFTVINQYRRKNSRPKTVTV